MQRRCGSKVYVGNHFFHWKMFAVTSLPSQNNANDDKATDHNHVMTKIRSVEPLTVFVVELDGHSLPCLEGQGYAPSNHAGATFSGVRETRHKEWDPKGWHWHCRPISSTEGLWRQC